MAASLSYRHIFGVKGNVKNGLHFYDDKSVLYPAGHHIVKYAMQSRLQEYINGADDSNGITSVAVSRTRRLVAVAEEYDEEAVVYVYKLRRLVRAKRLSTPEIRSNRIVHMDFSADDALLLTLSGAPDWRLAVWQLDSGKLLAHCEVSDDPSHEMHHCSFNPSNPTKICVCGDEVFKFLSLEEDQRLAVIPNSPMFSSRQPQRYLSHLWLPEDRSVLATDSGELLLFHREAMVAVIPSSPADNLAIDCIVPFADGFLTAGEGGVIRLYRRSSEEGVHYNRPRSWRIGAAAEGSSARVHSMAVSPSENSLAVLTCGNQLLQLDLEAAVAKEETPFRTLVTPMHGPRPDGAVGPADPSIMCALTGMDVCVRKPLVVTAGVDNTIRLWNYAEKSMELCQTLGEPVSSVAIHPSGLQVLVGCQDRLRMMNVLLDELRLVKALPVKACRECRFSTGGHTFAAANNTYIQIYSSTTLQLLSTLRGHSGRVQSLAWSSRDERLLSAGLDGAIYLWNWRSGKREQDFVNKGVQYTSAQLGKASPVGEGTAAATAAAAGGEAAGAKGSGSAAASGEGASVYAVGNDQKLHEVDMQNTTVRKEVEHDVTLGRVVTSADGRMLFSAASGVNRVGNVFSYITPITDGECVAYPAVSAPTVHMALSYDGSHLFVAGADGCLVVMEVRDRDGLPVTRDGAVRLPWSGEVLVTRADLEEMARVITELSDQYEELVQNNEFDMRMREIQFQDRMKKLTEHYQAQLDQQKTQLALVREETEDLQRDFGERTAAMQVAHHAEMQKREGVYQNAIMDEVTKYQQLAAEVERGGQDQDKRREDLVRKHEREVAEVTEQLERRLEAARAERVAAERYNAGMLRDWEEERSQMEEDLREQTQGLQHRNEARLDAEKQVVLKCKSDAGIMQKKSQALQQELDEYAEQIEGVREKARGLEAQQSDLDSQIRVLKAMIMEKDSTIGDKEKEIYSLKKTNQELEKFKFVLDYKIKELKRQIEPRENEIEAMRKQIKDVDAELEVYHKANNRLDQTIGTLRRDLDQQAAALRVERRAAQEVEAEIEVFVSDIDDVSAIIMEPAKLRARVARLYEKHAPADMRVEKVEPVVAAEFRRQADYLARSSRALKRKLTTDSAANRADLTSVIQANMSLIGEINRLRDEVARVRQSRQDQRMGVVVGGGARSIRTLRKSKQRANAGASRGGRVDGTLPRAGAPATAPAAPGRTVEQLQAQLHALQQALAMADQQHGGAAEDGAAAEAGAKAGGGGGGDTPPADLVVQ